EPPNQLILFLRGLGIRSAGVTFPQPDTRQSPPDPRQANQSRPESSLRPFGLHQSGLGGMALHVAALLALLSISIVLTYFLPDRLRVMRDMLKGPWSHKLRIMAIGMFGYLAAALLASVLAALVSGLIYAVLVIAILTGMTVVGLTSVALALGRWLTVRVGASPLPLAQLLVGLLVIFPLTVLPYYAGWVAAGIVASFGMGTILLTRIGAGTPWSLETLQ
ncbi:MAG: hypothetical protein Q8R28_18470, partial [Dehalococcoidia bacterium]|nr:hypothetical protein [Dehalococcoidia bacterium]